VLCSGCSTRLTLRKTIAGEKLIVTAGALDVHVHYICTQIWGEVSHLTMGLPTPHSRTNLS
jgi:urease alpha subunit